MDLNKVFIIGRLTRDPELKSLPSGVKVANFGMATNRRYKDKDDNWQEASEFHNIVVFGRQAETTSQYLNKGSMALIEGRLQTRSWESDGQKKYMTEVIAERVQFGPKNAGGGSNEGGKYDQSGKSDAESSQDANYPEAEEGGINPDDIPF
jgi:single-strand DNA-binding protein